jgi:hypothetical protein
MNGGDPSLQGEVQAAVSVSRFKTRCAGRKVKFVFVFTLIEENPSDNVIPPFVRFVPPNRFELTFHRVKPNLHDMPFVEEPPK